MHNKPYLSVQYGNDNECLEILIRLHAETQTPVIVDTTHNTGKMWKGCAFQPLWKLDLAPDYCVSAQADFKALPLRAGCCDVLVFDPPHTGSDTTTTGIVAKWGKSYGLETFKGATSLKDAGIFEPFLCEATRVLRAGGIILCKLSDIIRSQGYHWQMVEFVNAACGAGMTPCDLMIKVSGVGTMVSGAWKTQQHLRRAHSYWIVVRNASYDAARRNFAVNYERMKTTPMFP